ncbi:hypothetical protein [Leptolyngbya sp. GGD]|nr:hypothetical protein [Leptolyngbya sp. GGD]MCY6492847.1 hypothetical protein [Leptolyngbya sp. GGD]
MQFLDSSDRTSNFTQNVVVLNTIAFWANHLRHLCSDRSSSV